MEEDNHESTASSVAVGSFAGPSEGCDVLSMGNRSSKDRRVFADSEPGLDLSEFRRVGAGEVSVDDKTYTVSDKRSVLLYGLSEGQRESFQKQVEKEVWVTGKFEPAPSDRYPRNIIFSLK